ncbi:MAG TPA: putative Fe-S cluster assembly protein SufT [Steroidobacteraceae bacterium]|jgi:probable FeS assembly SUF system protein SufT|nr:putative Fe-S cluster assembly protein SufT [Steroidobacteraceae bacterium]
MPAYENEPVVIMREVEAVMVPSGQTITLKLGLAGYITQALGGSFTLYVDGNLYRISGENADAIGKEVVRAPKLPADATEEDVRALVWEQMRGCYDPEIPINIVDLGLVYECRIDTNTDQTRDVQITMTLTAPGCGMGEVLVQEVQEKVAVIPTVRKVEVELTFDPPWSQSMMSEAARLQTGMW